LHVLAQPFTQGELLVMPAAQVENLGRVENSTGG
jgi:hypothetical protein